MTSPLNEGIARVLEEAAQLPPERREPYVRQHMTDPGDLDEALGLLPVYPEANTSGAISRAIGMAFSRSAHAHRRSLIGKVIGKYRIVSILGQGGSGTVYLAERADKQYSAQVAVKIIDESAAASFGLRFRAERQILASLNHANIARLMDAGETEDHRPYLVMEYIHGEPVDQYCDCQRLGVRERLELFLHVCGAVQYAHQNLIVHRDIKPANILVTTDAVPKLLDFGIAKLLDASDVTKPSDLTRMNDRLLTPEYASPEQILGKPVTTASDVYSLGVVLYQLLTGLRPYSLSSSSASQLELERKICIVDPTRPSAAVAAAKSGAPTEDEPSMTTLAAARRTTPEKLQRSLEGDLDAIIMRALRKEPQHRYGSVDQLIGDIRSYLYSQPVQARQGNWAYHSSRFIKRNKLAVGAGTFVTALVVASLITVSFQRAQTEAALEQMTLEKNRAEQVTAFMTDTFAAANPNINGGKELSARELLDRGNHAILINPKLERHPAEKAAFQFSIGVAYRYLGSSNEAVAVLESALRLRRELSQDADPKVMATLVELAAAERGAGHYEQSAAHLAEAHQIMANLGMADPEARAELLVQSGRLATARSSPHEAKAAFEEALVLMRQARGPTDPEVASILDELANIETWVSDDFTRAEALAREAVDIYRSMDDYAHHPDRIKADFILGDILLLQGKLREAADILERTLVAQREVFRSNATVAETLSSLAQVRLAQHEPAAAEQFVREALAIHRDTQSTAYSKIGFLQTMLGQTLLHQNKPREAEPVLRETLDVFSRAGLPPDHMYVASAEHYLGEALSAMGELSDAEAHFTAAAHRWSRTDAPEWRAARSLSALGDVLHKQGRNLEAERKLVESYRTLATSEGVEPALVETARERVARFYRDTGRLDHYEALVRELPVAPTKDARVERAL